MTTESPQSMSPAAYFSSASEHSFASPFDAKRAAHQDASSGLALQSIERTACLAWGPSATTSASGNPLMAVATVAGALDASFSTACTLDIFELSLDHTITQRPIASVSAPSRFHKLAWSAHPEASSGSLIGAMEDGNIAVWSASKVLAGGQPAPTIKKDGSHPVRTLGVSSHSAFLFATGSHEGQVVLYDLNDLSKSFTPGTQPRSARLDLVTDVAWSRAHAFILCAASSNGNVVMWDLRSRREILQISTGSSVSALAWNPEEPTNLAASSDDNSQPVIRTWDLRNANAPDKILGSSGSGHSKGILSLAWCPQDSDLLLSSGKDNKIAFWNPKTATLLGQVEASSNWVYDLQWWPRNPNLFASASFDGKVNVYSYQSLSSSSTLSTAENIFGAGPASTAVAASKEEAEVKQIPKWLKRPMSMCFGFGGQLLSTHGKQIRKHPAVTKTMSLDEAINSNQLPRYCEQQTLSDPKGAFFWRALQKITGSGGNFRQAMLDLLDVKTPSVEDTSPEEEEEDDADGEQVPPVDAANESSPPIPFDVTGGVTALTDDFAALAASSPPLPQQSPEATNLRRRSTFSGQPFKLYPERGSPTDVDITKAIIAGNYQRAVDLCIKADRLSDALLVSVCGGPTLVSRTQRHYVRTVNLPYLRIVSGIVKGDLQDVIDNADVHDWRDLLALIWAKSASDADARRLSILLAERLSISTSQDDYLHGAIVGFVVGGDASMASALILKASKRAIPDNKASLSLWITQLVERIRLVHWIVQQSGGRTAGSLSDLVCQQLPELLRWFVLYAFLLEERGLGSSAASLLTTLASSQADLSSRVPTGTTAFVKRLAKSSNTQTELQVFIGSQPLDDARIDVVAEAPEPIPSTFTLPPQAPFSAPSLYNAAQSAPSSYDAAQSVPSSYAAHPSQPSYAAQAAQSSYTAQTGYGMYDAQYPGQPQAPQYATAPQYASSQNVSAPSSYGPSQATGQYANAPQYAQYQKSATTQYAQYATTLGASSTSQTAYDGANIQSSAPYHKPQAPSIPAPGPQPVAYGQPPQSTTSSSARSSASINAPPPASSMQGPPTHQPVMTAFNDAPIVQPRAPRAAPPMIASPVANAAPAYQPSMGQQYSSSTGGAPSQQSTAPYPSTVPPARPTPSPQPQTLSSSHPQSQAQSQSQSQGQPQTHQVPPDPTKIPGHLQPVYQALNGLIGVCMQRASPSQRRIVEDSVRRLQTMISQLCGGSPALSQGTQQSLLQLATLVQRQAWDEATQACQQLMSVAFSECGQWIVACRRLIEIGKDVTSARPL